MFAPNFFYDVPEYRVHLIESFASVILPECAKKEKDIPAIVIHTLKCLSVETNLLFYFYIFLMELISCIFFFKRFDHLDIEKQVTFIEKMSKTRITILRRLFYLSRNIILISYYAD